MMCSSYILVYFARLFSYEQVYFVGLYVAADEADTIDTTHTHTLSFSCPLSLLLLLFRTRTRTRVRAHTHANSGGKWCM